MNDSEDLLEQFNEMRRAAARKAAMNPEVLRDMSPDEIKLMLHELQVHQFQLEMQNENLRVVHGMLDAARARYAELYDLAPVGYLTLSEDGLILEANLIAATLLGDFRNALIKQDLSQFISNEDQDLYSLHRKQLFEAGKPQTCELRMKRKDGALFWAHLEADATAGPDATRTCRVVLSDITGLKQVEEAVRESGERYHGLIMNLEAGVVVHAPDTSIVMNNARAALLLGLSDDQMKGKVAIDPAWKFVNGDGLPLPFEEYPVNRVVNGKKPIRNQLLGICKPGVPEIGWVTVNGFPVLNSTNDITEIVVSFIDITASKIAEDMLQVEKANSDAIFESSPVAMFVLDEKIQIVRINTAALILTGGSAADVLDHRPGNALGCVHSSKDPRGCGYSLDCPLCPVRNGIEGLLASGGSLHGAEMALELIRDGAPRKIWLLLGAKPVQIDGRRHLCVALDDITERKQAEAALKESNDVLELFVKNSLIYTYIKSVTPTESRVVRASDNFRKMVGIAGSDMVGKTMEELFPADMAAQITADDWAVVSSGEPLSLDEELNGRSYTTLKFPLQVGGKTLLAGYTIDITDRKQAEEELRESEVLQRNLLTQLPAGVVIVDALTRTIERVNERAAVLFGGRAEQMIGHRCHSFLCPAEEKSCPILDLGQKVDNSERVMILADGRRCPIQKSVTRIHVGGREKLLECFVDITERKRAAEELRARNEELERINNVLVNRELRMIELKAEINALLKTTGQPEKYKIIGEND